MSTAYVPVPTILPGTVTLPQDLVDQRSAASVNVPFATLADAIAYLMASDPHYATISLESPVGYTAEIAKTYDIKNEDLTKITTGAVIDDTGLARQAKFVVTNAGAALARHLVWDITPLMIHGGTLTSVTVGVKGNGAHLDLPANMPAIALARYEWLSDTWASLLAANTKDDTSASAAALDTAHEYTLTCDQNNTIDVKKYTYHLVGINESGANALEGYTFYGAYATISAARYRA